MEVRVPFESYNWKLLSVLITKGFSSVYGPIPALAVVGLATLFHIVPGTGAAALYIQPLPGSSWLTADGLSSIVTPASFVSVTKMDAVAGSTSAARSPGENAKVKVARALRRKAEWKRC
jgi:hypothetical protein